MWVISGTGQNGSEMAVISKSTDGTIFSHLEILRTSAYELRLEIQLIHDI